MRQVGATEAAAGGGATGPRRGVTTLLELATALSDLVQNDRLAGRLLVEVVRSGAVRTVRGVAVQLSRDRVYRAYAHGHERWSGTGTDPRGGSA